MKPIPFVDLAAQRAALGPALETAACRAIARGDYVLGGDVAAFEAEFAWWCGARHAVGVSSGSAALEIALLAHGVGPGDEVITAANSFVATAFSISAVGATPVLVDVDLGTLLIDPAEVEAAITPRTRAIVPVHLYGQPADMRLLRAIAREAGVALIEDACQAHGARELSRRAGALGDAAAFSFYPAKNLGGCGDGGMLVTDSDEVAEQARLLRNYGQRVKYRSDIVGGNHRLDTLQAALLRVKLPHLDNWNQRRAEHAARYEEALGDLPVVLPLTRPCVEPVWHLYVVRVPRRDEVRNRLGAMGIETGIHYPIPIHEQPAYASLGHKLGDFPVTEAAAREILSLPMYPELPEDAPARVAEALELCLAELPEPAQA